jgi:hypothetical protein
VRPHPPVGPAILLPLPSPTKSHPPTSHRPRDPYLTRICLQIVFFCCGISDDATHVLASRSPQRINGAYVVLISRTHCCCAPPHTHLSVARRRTEGLHSILRQVVDNWTWGRRCWRRARTGTRRTMCALGPYSAALNLRACGVAQHKADAARRDSPRIEADRAHRAAHLT